jgi:hypothetical protein
VVYGCKGDLCPDLVTQIVERGTIEILDIVNGDLLRNSVATDDVLPEESLDSGRGYVGYTLCFNQFGEVFPCDNDKNVISMCWCMFTHDIDAPPLQGPGWGYQL